MKHYYITDPSSDKGFVEVSEAEFQALVGDETTHPYANPVYREELSINEVPEDLQTQVQAVVDAKIARWGKYKNQKITSNELQSLIEEVL